MATILFKTEYHWKTERHWITELRATNWIPDAFGIPAPTVDWNLFLWLKVHLDMGFDNAS